MIEKFKSLDKIVRQIIILVVIVLVLFLGTVILKNVTTEKKFRWDYNEIITAENVLDKGEKVDDRVIYWQLKEIVYDYISTMQDEELEEQQSVAEKISYTEYYDVLSKKYKKHLNKEDYEATAKIFINKFLNESHLGNKYVTDFVIDEIYKYEDNMYLCVVIEESMQKKGYIGIQLHEQQSRFSIFYIE